MEGEKDGKRGKEGERDEGVEDRKEGWKERER